MDVRLSFDLVPEVYDRARPTYPGRLVDLIMNGLGVRPQVLEMGPGTGQLTSMLLDRGATVTAVELGPNLARFLSQKFQGQPSLTVLNDSFESALVEPHSFDAVVASTAYHWVADDVATSRPAELLRPGGLFGVIDLIQVDSPIDDGYFARVRPIYERYNEAAWDDPKTHETAQPAIAETCRRSDQFANVEVHRERWDQTYTSAQYRDLLWSYSGTQMKPEPERTRMVDELVAVIDDEYNGTLTRPLVATLTLAVRS